MASPQPPATRTACVVSGATPDRVAGIGGSDKLSVRANRLGTLVTGRPGDLVIDYAAELHGPVYDVMYSATTGWFSVTVFRGSPTCSARRPRRRYSRCSTFLPPRSAITTPDHAIVRQRTKRPLSDTASR